jgi:tetratricopeptide (TPR) repeat protein
LFWLQSAHGQSPELSAASERVLELYSQGRYEEAAPLADKAVRLSEQEFGPDDPFTATMLNYLALLYHAQGRYGEAEPLYERALAIQEKALGAEHPSVAASLNNLADLYRVRKAVMAKPSRSSRPDATLRRLNWRLARVKSIRSRRRNAGLYVSKVEAFSRPKIGRGLGPCQS